MRAPCFFQVSEGVHLPTVTFGVWILLTSPLRSPIIFVRFIFLWLLILDANSSFLSMNNLLEVTDGLILIHEAQGCSFNAEIFRLGSGPLPPSPFSSVREGPFEIFHIISRPTRPVYYQQLLELPGIQEVGAIIPEVIVQ